MVAYTDTTANVVHYTVYTYNTRSGSTGNAGTIATTESLGLARGRVEIVVVEPHTSGFNEIPQYDPPPSLFCPLDIWDRLRSAQPRPRLPRVPRARRTTPPRLDQRWHSAIRAFS
jgi:hypothetical protein